MAISPEVLSQLQQVIQSEDAEELDADEIIEIINREREDESEFVPLSQSTLRQDLPETVFKRLQRDDVVENRSQFVTQGVWSQGRSRLTCALMELSSCQQTEPSGRYFFEVWDQDPDIGDQVEAARRQFAVAYGNVEGEGGTLVDENTPNSREVTRANYSQYKNTFLSRNQDRFEFGEDEEIPDDFYAINIYRSRYKEIFDPGNWELKIRFIDIREFVNDFDSLPSYNDWLNQYLNLGGVDNETRDQNAADNDPNLVFVSDVTLAQRALRDVAKAITDLTDTEQDAFKADLGCTVDGANLNLDQYTYSELTLVDESASEDVLDDVRLGEVGREINVTSGCLNQNDPNLPADVIRPGDDLLDSDTRKYGLFYPDAGAILLNTVALNEHARKIARQGPERTYDPDASEFSYTIGNNRDETLRTYVNNNTNFYSDEAVAAADPNDNSRDFPYFWGFDEIFRAAFIQPDLGTDTVKFNHGRIFRAIKTGSSFIGRSVEEVNSTHYFIRVRNREFNFSNNPTFAGADGEFTIEEFLGNPKVFITTVGLYDEDNTLVAVAKLSEPVQKDFGREALIQIKLDY